MTFKCVFKKHSNTERQVYVAGSFNVPPSIHFFIPPFSKCTTEIFPPAESVVRTDTV